jgi:hypothetical protein
MAIRIHRSGETIYGQFASGDVHINLPPNQENLLLESGIAVRLDEEDLEIVLAGGVGSGVGSSGSDDIDAITLVLSGPALGKPLTFQDEFSWTMTYDASGQPLSATIEGSSPAVTQNFAKVGDYWIVTGSVRRVSGALLISGVQAAGLKTASDAFSTSIRHGARIMILSAGGGYSVGPYWWNASTNLFVAG